MPAGESNRKFLDFCLFSSAAAVSVLGWVYIPIFSVIAALVIPVALAMLVIRQDLRYGLASLILIAAVAAAVTLNPRLALLLTVQTGPLGLFLGLLFKNHVPSGKALVAAVSFSLAICLGIFTIGHLLSGVSPFDLNERQQYIFDQERLMLHQMFGQGGTAGQLEPETMKELETVIDRVEALWPVFSVSTTLIWFMALAGVAFLVTRRVMARFGYRVPPVAPFSRWRLPWYMIWGIIAGLALMLGGDQFHLPGLSAAGRVALWVTGFVLSVIGASVLAFYLRRLKLAWPLKVIGIIIMAVYLPVTAGVLAAAGIADSIWNIRRLTPEGRTPEEENKK